MLEQIDPAELAAFEQKYPNIGRWLRLLIGWLKPQSWREIGDAAGKNPAFDNSWVNFGSDGTRNWSTAAFMKDLTGRVWLKGTIKSGTVASVPAFTLPEGYAPLKAKLFDQVDGSRSPSAVIEVYASDDSAYPGEVQITRGNNGHISLEGISWLV